MQMNGYDVLSNTTFSRSDSCRLGSDIFCEFYLWFYIL